MCGSLIHKEGFGSYGAPDRTFGAPYMASVDLNLTDSAAVTTGINFSPLLGHCMHPDSDAAAVSIDGCMTCHYLFDFSAPCHCISSF